MPQVNLQTDRKNGNALLKLIRNGKVTCAHDCSKGGLGVALAEMAVSGGVGFRVDVGSAPNSCQRLDDLLFSESNSRYVFGTKEPDKVQSMLSSEGVPFSQIGDAEATTLQFFKGKTTVAMLPMKSVRARFYSLEKTLR